VGWFGWLTLLMFVSSIHSFVLSDPGHQSYLSSVPAAIIYKQLACLKKKKKKKKKKKSEDC